MDISRLSIDQIAESGDTLTVGALARHRDVERSDVIKAGYPLMATAAPLISDPVVRNLGTIGGSLCHADPAGDWGSVMTVDVASAVYRSAFEDTTYYFCSAGCLSRFEEDPARFVAAVPGT